MAIITPEEVRKIASISRLEILESELPVFVEQLQAVLNYSERVIQIAADVAVSSSKQVNVFRDDSTKHTDQEAILAQAPVRMEDYFVVPVIIENS